MCRLLAVKSKMNFNPKTFLESFASMCKTSKEYQGHGWGYSILINDNWRVFKNIKPIWEETFDDNEFTTQLIVHARSAFKDEGILVENNMPFYDEKYQFIFNGELQGVKIKEDGRIGAEKIFNYIKRFDKGNFGEAFKHAINIIDRQTRYIKAMNIIVSDKARLYVNNMYNEDAEYFSMQFHESGGMSVICSQKLDIIDDWQLLANKTFKVIE